MDVLVKVKEAFSLFGSIVLNKIDGRTFAINSHGICQLEVIVDSRTVGKCGNVVLAGAFGVDLCFINRKGAVAARRGIRR